MRWVMMLMALSIPVSAEQSKLTGAQISSMLSDKTLYATINGKSAEQLFLKNGATYYSLDGAQNQGAWKIENDKYCSVWPPNETWVCYDVLQDEKHVSFVSPSGSVSDFSLTQ